MTKEELHKLLAQSNKKPRRRIQQIEEGEQIALADYLNALGLHWTHPPNGGLRSMSVAAKLKAQGVSPGIPDCIIFDAPPLYPCAPGVVIELKRPKGGTVSKEQKDWLAYLKTRGWLVFMAHGFDQAKSFLFTLGWGRKDNR